MNHIVEHMDTQNDPNCDSLESSDEEGFVANTAKHLARLLAGFQNTVAIVLPDSGGKTSRTLLPVKKSPAAAILRTGIAG